MWGLDADGAAGDSGMTSRPQASSRKGSWRTWAGVGQAPNPYGQEKVHMNAGVLGAIVAVVAGALFVAFFRSKGKRKP